MLPRIEAEGDVHVRMADRSKRPSSCRILQKETAVRANSQVEATRAKGELAVRAISYPMLRRAKKKFGVME